MPQLGYGFYEEERPLICFKEKREKEIRMQSTRNVFITFFPFGLLQFDAPPLPLQSLDKQTESAAEEEKLRE